MNSPLHHWLEHQGHKSLQRLEQRLENGPHSKLRFSQAHQNFSFNALIDPEENYIVQDKLSQINTLQQVENITSQNFLADILKEKQVNLHAFWFELETGDLHIFSKAKERYVVVEEKSVNDLIKELEG